MHVVFLADPVDTQMGGIHVYCVNALKAILKHGGEHRVTILKTSKDNFFSGETYALKGNPWNPIRKFHSIPKAIEKLNPDVVVEMAHMGPFNLPEHIRRVTIIHDLSPVLFPQYHPFLSQSLQRKLFPQILKNTDHILTHAECTRQDLEQTYAVPAEKISILSLGVSDVFVPKKDPSILAKYSIEQPYFLSVGTVEPRKNYVRLLQAYQQFRDASNVPINLVLVGRKGWKSAEFYRVLKKHPYRADITLLQHVPSRDVPALYSQCQSFVFPSLFEGFGLPLLEAMSCGACCVTSDTSSLPEVGGDAVLYVDPESVEDLATAMRKSCIEEVHEKLCRRALERSKSFSWDRYGRGIWNILTKSL